MTCIPGSSHILKRSKFLIPQYHSQAFTSPRPHPHPHLCLQPRMLSTDMGPGTGPAGAQLFRPHISLGKCSSKSQEGDSRRVGSLGPCISNLSLCFDKIPNKLNLRKGGFIRAPSSLRSVMAGKSWWQELEVCGHSAPLSGREMQM